MTTSERPQPSELSNPVTPRATPAAKKRQGVAVGLAGGLLAGTAAGLILGVPGLTSAASPAPFDVSALVQQSDTEPTDAPAAPGERWRETLQELVDDGTITAEQADAVAAHLAEQFPRRGDGMGNGERPGPSGHGRPGGAHDIHGDVRFGRGAGVISEALTDLLDIDAQDLRAQLRDGATLAEIAAAHGIDPDAVVDALVGELAERLDHAVGNGRLDRADADEKLAAATQRITDLVNEGRTPAD